MFLSLGLLLRCDAYVSPDGAAHWRALCNAFIDAIRAANYDAFNNAIRAAHHDAFSRADA